MLTQADGARRVQRAVLLYLLVFIGWNLITWIWFAMHRHAVGHQFPLGTRVERFGDLLRFSAKYQIGKDPRQAEYGLGGTLFPRNYPPFSVVIYLFLLERCAPFALFVMLGIVVPVIVVACVLLWRKVRRMEFYRGYMGAAIFLTGLFGWGTEMIVMRGNIEGLMLVCILIGAGYYAHRRFGWAAVWFALATCIKPYPILWLFLMARHRKYREVAVGCLTAAVATLGSLMAMDLNPVRAWRHISAKSTFFEDYIVSFRPMEEMKGDHSILQSMKTVTRIVRYHGLHFPPSDYFSLHSSDPLAWKLYLAYQPLAVIAGLVVLWRVWNKPVLNQIFAVCCISTLLPLIAADYTLAVLMIPMGFFLIFLLRDVASGSVAMPFGHMLWFVLPSAWIMGTEPLWIVHGVLKCIAVALLLGASVSIPLPASAFEEAADRTDGVSGSFSSPRTHSAG